jgi:hypothetical protein
MKRGRALAASSLVDGVRAPLPAFPKAIGSQSPGKFTLTAFQFL